MDVNSCTGHPYTPKFFINMENVMGINIHIFRKIKAPVTMSTLDLTKMENFSLCSAYNSLCLSSWRWAG